MTGLNAISVPFPTLQLFISEQKKTGEGILIAAVLLKNERNYIL